jgi:hypothetical protein
MVWRDTASITGQLLLRHRPGCAGACPGARRAARHSPRPSSPAGGPGAAPPAAWPLLPAPQMPGAACGSSTGPVHASAPVGRQQCASALCRTCSSRVAPSATASCVRACPSNSDYLAKPVRRLQQRQQHLAAVITCPAGARDAHGALQHRIQAAGRVAAAKQRLPCPQLPNPSRSQQGFAQGWRNMSEPGTLLQQRGRQCSGRSRAW